MARKPPADAVEPTLRIMVRDGDVVLCDKDLVPLPGQVCSITHCHVNEPATVQVTFLVDKVHVVFD